VFRLEPATVTEAVRARVVTGAVIGIIVLCAVTGLEIWPFSGFRLFSVVRTQEQVSWQLRTVDAAGEEAKVDVGAMPDSYRGEALVIPELASMSDVDRRAVIHAWLEGAGVDLAPVVSVRVYRVDTLVPTEPSEVATPVSTTQVLDVSLR
jgi:hypothetical protein